MKQVLAVYKRKSWDRSITDMSVMGPIIDQNMQILKEVSEEIVPGYSERELLLKRFIFRE